MTEQEFQRQVWRPYDRITTAEGVPGKVLGVNFTFKSVRAFISGAPEWVKCDLIETHTTGKGGDADDAAIIEELHNKVVAQTIEIERLKEESKLLKEKVSMNRYADILRAINTIQQGLTEKKKKMEQIDSGLQQIQEALSKIEK